MTIYSITYDLIKSKNYEKIINGIEKISGGNWARPTMSQWLIYSTKTSEQIRKYLLECIDNDDMLFVIEVQKQNWASWNVSNEVTGWFSKPVQ